MIYMLYMHIVASHLRRGSVVTVAVGQINGGLSDCGPLSHTNPLSRYPNSRPRVDCHNIYAEYVLRPSHIPEIRSNGIWNHISSNSVF